MINFYSENNFRLSEERQYEEWLKEVISSEGKKIGEISFIFCDDEYLLEINQKYLDHDTYTDIISFDNSVGNILGGDIFISTERVMENAANFNVSFDEELKRVMVHGVLHFCGYRDKTSEEKEVMRSKEEEKMKMFHVEQ
ncbi:MAG TPA: rRNA maturation RNase YbeY [Salinimicrobium catena]|uniref:Endoribonuclease YbeY n=1 Tax=Salinimicrobium catena TaxID=390640 RepID=A0A7C2R6C6_9FLAO|nr:rRNA maturation RNase YbeY [Salinimicrobium catena]